MVVAVGAPDLRDPRRVPPVVELLVVPAAELEHHGPVGGVDGPGHIDVALDRLVRTAPIHLHVIHLPAREKLGVLLVVVVRAG